MILLVVYCLPTADTTTTRRTAKEMKVFKSYKIIQYLFCCVLNVTSIASGVACPLLRTDGEQRGARGE